MESDVLARLKVFSLSVIEDKGVELLDTDVSIGMEERRRSLIGKVFGEKRSNFVGVKSTMMKLWQHRGLTKVVTVAPNVYQFVFEHHLDREKVMLGRPWLFDNQLLVLLPWEEDLQWTDDRFNFSPLWIQVWHIPPH